MIIDDFACLPIEYDGEYLWCVFEHATQQVVRSFFFEDDAHEYIRFLRSGGAFAGFTPAFVLQDIPTTRSSINETFASEFI